MEFLHLAVGEKFDHDMPAEAISIILANGSPMLTFNFLLTERQISAFLNGTTSFGLFFEPGILFFLFKIDGFLEWSDLAFTIHLAGDEEVEESSSYLPFHLVLVESETKIIKGLRVVTVSPAFRSLLVRITRQQAKERLETINYYSQIGELYQAYPSADDMLKKALVIEQGGMTLPD